MTSKKDVKDLVKALRAEGYVVDVSGGNHTRVTDPATGVQSTFPLTPSDYRGMLNACQQLKKSGFSFTFRGKRYSALPAADK